jgi:hypothetical protein
MNFKTLALPMVCVYLMLISATTTSIRGVVADNKDQPSTITLPTTSVNDKKVNFFERLLFKVARKKFQENDVAEADKLATKSQTWGIIAISSVAAGLAFPPLLLFSLVASIVAMSAGRRALKGNTKEPGKARLGKGIGLAVLIASGILVIGLIIFLATFSLD